MYFNVSQLMKESSGSHREYEVGDTLELAGDTHRPISGQVQFLRTDRGIWASANLTTNVPAVCSRCVREYEQPIEIAIEEEFLPIVDVNTGARLWSQASASDQFYIDHNHTLDLTEAARQYSTMAAPMKPMCRKDCPGICFTCGTDLGDTACGCAEPPVDPRWSDLLELVSKKTGE